MNLKNYLDQNQLQKRYIKDPSKLKRIFFFRICGTGMGAAACLLKEFSFEISGTDITFTPPMSTYLESTQIPLIPRKNITKKALQKYDLIIVGNVIPRDSEDAQLIENSGVAFCSFPAALGAFILHTRKVIGIAGTHGKTTSTHFMVQIFKKLGQDIGYFIGGVLNNAQSSHLGKSPYFLIESDEYGCSYFERFSKFRQYKIDRLILTSLEFDHADIFESIDDIKNEFRAILHSLKKEVIFDEQYHHSNDLLQNNKLKPIPYGGKNGPHILDERPNQTTFQLKINETLYSFKTNIIGQHNILNLSACLLTAYKEGFPLKDIKNAILTLDMVKRRQEKRGYYNGCPIYDDFAHHPRSVQYTIEAMRIKYPQKEVYVIFEPHSATARSSLFQKEFTDSLNRADRVILTKPHASTTAQNLMDIDCTKMIKHLKKENTNASIVKSKEQLISQMKDWSNSNNIWLILSNGTCLGLWQSNFMD